MFYSLLLLRGIQSPELANACSLSRLQLQLEINGTHAINVGECAVLLG